MAKKSMWAREAKRAKIVAQYANKRAELKAIINDRSKSHEEIDAAVVALQKLPRDSNATRQRNRCSMTGRPRGYYRKFGLSRNKLREVCMQGEAPGVAKSSC